MSTLADTRQRRRRNWVLMGAVLVIMLAGTWSGRPERMPTPYFDLPRPMVIAHQGGNHLRPGNTFLAFDHALELGADVLEMDVHLSRDGQAVVIHDATVDRTTNGKGAVADFTLQQLEGLDAGYHWPNRDNATDKEPIYRGQGVGVPSLAGVLARYPTQRLLIELKADTEAMATSVCALLKAAKREDLTLVASFHRQVMRHFRRLCPKVATSATAAEVDQFLWLKKLHALKLYFSPSLALQVSMRRDDQSLATRAFVEAARDINMFVDYWTVNEPADMRALIKLRAQGIITDRPDLLLDELGRR